MSSATASNLQYSLFGIAEVTEQLGVKEAVGSTVDAASHPSC